ncbi:MAG: lysoplasmalogenase family protein [Bacillota bacterium]|nr:lysoplasmalogenase family protein [Bacillota bacterium]
MNLDKCTSGAGVITFLAIFGVVFVLELLFAFLEKQTARKIVKPFVMLSLLGLALCYDCSVSMIWVYLGIIFGLAGDVFLIFPRNDTIFSLGAFAFFIGHVFYMVQMVLMVGEDFSFVIPIIWAALIVSYFLCTFRISKKISQNLFIRIGMILYTGTLLVMLVTSVTFSFMGWARYLILVYAGYIFFIGSDIYLIYVNFIKHQKREDFYIMGTYMAAQFLIVFGLLLTSSI